MHINKAILYTKIKTLFTEKYKGTPTEPAIKFTLCYALVFILKLISSLNKLNIGHAQIKH